MKNIERSAESSKVAAAPSAHVEKKTLTDAELVQIVGAKRGNHSGEVYHLDW